MYRKFWANNVIGEGLQKQMRNLAIIKKVLYNIMDCK